MPFKKGVSGNKNGRPKGSGNKNGNEAVVSVFMDTQIDKQFIRFEEELGKLKGRDFISVFLKIARIMSHDNSGTIANKQLIEMFNKKIKNYVTNK